jgi:hypothetical protein
MTDIQELKQSLLREQEQCRVSTEALSPAEALELIARIEQLEKVAARYDLLRNTDWDELEVVKLMAGPDYEHLRGGDLDAHLDRAIAAQSTKEQG